jgi:heme/copper-type cytochrome/quinol oxidase subunit 3
MLGGGILGIFTRNLVVQFNAWFLLYLYLVLSLILSAAPSMQDIRNAAIGISIMVITGLLILWSQYPLAVNALTEIMRIMAMGFGLGLGFGLIALVLSSPLILIFFFRRIA